MVQESSMTDTTRDDPLEWHVVFDDGKTIIQAANLFDGVWLLPEWRQRSSLQFLPGYRVKYEPEMDRARLVRR